MVLPRWSNKSGGVSRYYREVAWGMADAQEESEQDAEDTLLASFQAASLDASRKLQQKMQLGDWLDLEGASIDAETHRANQLSEWLDTECGFQPEWSLKPSPPPISPGPHVIVQEWPDLQAPKSRIPQSKRAVHHHHRHKDDVSMDVSRMVSAWLGGPSTLQAVYHTTTPAPSPIGGWSSDGMVDHGVLLGSSSRAHPGASTSRRDYAPKHQERVFSRAIRGVMEEANVDGDVLDARWHSAARASSKARGALRRAIGKQSRGEAKNREHRLLKPIISARLAVVTEEAVQQSDAREAELVARGMARMMLGAGIWEAV